MSAAVQRWRAAESPRDGTQHGVSVLQFLSDVFMREKIACKVKSGKSLPFATWIQTNGYMQKLRALGVHHFELITSAMQSYTTRIAPLMQLDQSVRIQGSLSEVAESFGGVCDFIVVLVNHYDAVPFQFDFPLIFRAQRQLVPDDNDSDSDEDEDIDSDDKGEKNTDEESIFDIGQGVRQFRNETKNKAYAFHMRKERSFARKMCMAFDTFIAAWKFRGREFGLRNRRFILAFDMRSDADLFDDAFEEDKFLIDPPPKSGRFNHQTVQEWHFEATRQFILPHAGNSSNRETQTFASRSRVPGALTFSFHVKSKTEIRCYLYHNGGVMRFMPRDIVDVLPLLFDEDFGDNRYYARSSDAKGACAYCKPRLPDAKFQDFFAFATSSSSM